MTAVMSGVRVEKDLVFAGTWRADTVIGITVRPVEVEDEKSAGAIENDHLFSERFLTRLLATTKSV